VPRAQRQGRTGEKKANQRELTNPIGRVLNRQVTGKVFTMDYVENRAEGEGFEPPVYALAA
jgi:hypothetical protein